VRYFTAFYSNSLQTAQRLQCIKEPLISRNILLTESLFDILSYVVWALNQLTKQVPQKWHLASPDVTF